ncbi:MAG: hypothetical protein CL894_04030 [Dehalococcoidia bacterium]|jgi:hypothetical protein|nr:hypothetical protein [Dehalococcoidia bacterium]
MRSMHMADAGKVLLEIRQLLNDANIIFFLRHGTCLGAVRDGELIPWDDDIDIGSIIGMHNLDEPSILQAVDGFKRAGFQVKVLETDFHIGVELSKLGIPVDWTCYRVFEKSILQYPGVKIPVQIYEDLSTVSLLDNPFLVPSPPEEYLTLKYGPDWRVPKKTGFEADIIDSIPESINLGVKYSIFTRVLKFLFPSKYSIRITVLSADSQPIPMIEVAIAGVSRQTTDHDGCVQFDLSHEDYYAVDIRIGENREILYEEVLKPGGDYFYIQDPHEIYGRIHVLKEKA